MATNMTNMSFDYNDTLVVTRYSDFSNIWFHYGEINKIPLELFSLDNYNSDSLQNYQDTNQSVESRQPINETSLHLDNVTYTLINSFIVITCALGLVANGMVICLLGFHVKRNAFTTYILNLSIADFGVLISLMSTAALVSVKSLYDMVNAHSLLFLISFELFFLMYSASQFLLAAISTDRCVAVLFPIWHRCHRPPYLSTTICVLLWILSFLLSGIHFTLLQTGSFIGSPLIYQFILNTLLCAPLMFISTLILSIHVCHRLKQRNQGKLVTVILLALLFFIFFAVPLNVFYLINSYYTPLPTLMVVGLGCASLNSSINPLIYFLVGRKKGKLQVPMKVVLQTIFKDEQDSREQNTLRKTFI